MGVGAGGEVQSGYVGWSVVNVCKRLECGGGEGLDGPVLLIGETVKSVIVAADLPVELGYAVRVAKGGVKTCGQACERISHGYLVDEVLLDAFGIHKKEQPILEDRATEPAAKLIALKGHIMVAKVGAQRVVPK